MAKIKRNPVALKIADLILENYDLTNAKDANEALKDVFGSLFEKLLNAELDAHLGYDKNSQEPKETENRRNGFREGQFKALLERLKSQYQEIETEHLTL